MHWCISFLKYILILDQKRRLKYKQQQKLHNNAKKKKKDYHVYLLCQKESLFMSMTFSFASLCSNSYIGVA